MLARPAPAAADATATRWIKSRRGMTEFVLVESFTTVSPKFQRQFLLIEIGRQRRGFQKIAATYFSFHRNNFTARE